MVSIKKIKLSELEEFVNSDFFKGLKNKPISKIRANSYTENPRANKNDFVLYMAFLENELVSYRTILSDIFFVEKKPFSFGWLSGNWVSEKHRRKGISTLLFKEVFKDWNGKLMYTNYAEASKFVYDKTNKFSLLKELKGTKYYMRFCLADILPKKRNVFKKIKPFLVFFDAFLNLILDFINLFKNQAKENDFRVILNEDWGNSILNFEDSFTSGNLFQRGEKEFNWIQKNPWILSDNYTKRASKEYHFSSYAKQFNSKLYTIYNNENSLVGFVFLTIRNGHVKIPYSHFLKKDHKKIAAFIVDNCKNIKAKTIVVYNNNLEKELNKKLPSIIKKEFLQKYFTTKELEKSLVNKENCKLQSGDGDVVFT